MQLALLFFLQERAVAGQRELEARFEGQRPAVEAAIAAADAAKAALAHARARREAVASSSPKSAQDE